MSQQPHMGSLQTQGLSTFPGVEIEPLESPYDAKRSALNPTGF
jgi:hypothetical protein